MSTLDERYFELLLSKHLKSVICEKICLQMILEICKIMYAFVVTSQSVSRHNQLSPKENLLAIVSELLNFIHACRHSTLIQAINVRQLRMLLKYESKILLAMPPTSVAFKLDPATWPQTRLQQNYTENELHTTKNLASFPC